MRKLLPVILCTLAFLMLASSCQKCETDHLAYREKDFCAVLEGSRDGKKFICEVTCKSGKAEKLVYGGEGVLAGVSLTAEGNGYRIERDGTQAPFPEPGGLLEPARLLLLEGAEICTVRVIAEGTLLTVKLPGSTEEISLTVGANGFPTVITSEKYSMQVKT